MTKEKGILKDLDSLDIDEVIFCIEKSFNIEFNEDDFLKIKTYGDFEDFVLSKIEGEKKDDCSSQQIFYKLRKVISESFEIEKEDFKTESKLTEIFPAKNRIQNIQILKRKLNIRDKFLTYSPSQFVLLFVTFISSAILVFFNLFYALLLFSIGMIFTEVFKTKTFLYKDIRELSTFLKTENYKNCRTDRNSYNPTEVKDIIRNIFSDKLDIKTSELNYNTLL